MRTKNNRLQTAKNGNHRRHYGNKWQFQNGTQFSIHLLLIYPIPAAQGEIKVGNRQNAAHSFVNFHDNNPEIGAINSSDIVPVFKEFKNPSHEEFAEPTCWSLLNAFTETIKKYTPQRVDYSYSALNRAFGLDGKRSELWERA